MHGTLCDGPGPLPPPPATPGCSESCICWRRAWAFFRLANCSISSSVLAAPPPALGAAGEEEYPAAFEPRLELLYPPSVLAAAGREDVYPSAFEPRLELL